MYTYEDAKFRALTLAYALHHFVAAVYRDADGWYCTSHVDVDLIDVFLPTWARDVEYCDVVCNRPSVWKPMQRQEVTA